MYLYNYANFLYSVSKTFEIGMLGKYLLVGGLIIVEITPIRVVAWYMYKVA